MTLYSDSLSDQIYKAGVTTQLKHAAIGTDPSVLTEIYQAENNIVVWKRHLTETLSHSVSVLLNEQPTFKLAMTVTPESALASLADSFGCKAQTEFAETIAELVDMFCCLFDLKRVGLRLATLDKAMCPKFHVDRVACRLVTTFQGEATEWLPHEYANREKLGLGSHGLADHESGLYQNEQDIQQLASGDVALLKGSNWEGNENAGIVHRSPALQPGEKRLLLTLDFSD